MAFKIFNDHAMSKKKKKFLIFFKISIITFNHQFVIKKKIFTFLDYFFSFENLNKINLNKINKC